MYRTGREQQEFEDGQEVDGEIDRPFSEVEELELAAELLEVSDEAELDQFLGKLFRGAGKKLSKIAGPLGGILKGVAKTALPFVGGALGSFIPIPGVGTALGTALGGAVSSALEMELEFSNAEDREFEMARRFVQFAGTAANEAAQASPGADSQAAARAAALAAARQHFPQIAGQNGAARQPRDTGQQRSGRWTQHGRTIVLHGVR